MGVAASGVVAGLGVISSSVDSILTSGDKAEIAKYQAQGEVAKANAIIVEAQAKADAQVAAEKAKSQITTYIIIGVVVLLVIMLVVVLISQRTPTQVVPSYQYKPLQKPIMPTNYVQSASPPRQLQPVAIKAI